MGHTMHTVLSHETQPFATSSYSIFVAEVASMTNESLFLDRLLAEEADPARRVTLLQHAIDDISAGFYRQAMFAEFELEAHRAVESGRPITAEVLQETYLGVLEGFFADTLDDQPWYRNTWARIPHFYGSPYYVFQYATSNEASRTATLASYLELLRSGGNDHPVTLLRKAGVDLATTEPTEALVAEMDGLVDRLEEELAKLDS
jgi:oligoendopeptidase F